MPFAAELAPEKEVPTATRCSNKLSFRMPAIQSPPAPEKVIPNRQGSLAADLGDDDGMRDELDRLSVAQMELQRELLNVVQGVETIQAIEDCNDGESSCLEDQDGSDEGSVEVEEEIDTTHTPKSFSQSFFELVKPRETLESQKKRQLEIVQENLNTIQPGLDVVADCQRQTQETIVKKSIQLEELRIQTRAKIERLLQSKPRSLEEEKERQKRILELSLDPELVQKLEKEQEAQSIILEKKQEELEATKQLMREKMKELMLASNSDQNEGKEDEQLWSAPRKHFEAKLGRKKVDQIQRSQRHFGAAVR